MTTTISTLDDDGRVDRSVEADDGVPAPPAGLSTPAIDHDKVTAAAEQMSGGTFTPKQAAATKTLMRELDGIREERRELNDRKTAAKAAFVECCPDVDFSAVMIAYVVYTNAVTEGDAAKEMTKVAETVSNVAGIYQPALW